MPARVYRKRERPDGEIQTWKRHTIEEDAIVLQVEELITTMTTLSRVRAGMTKGNSTPVVFAPVVGTLVNRSSHAEYDGSSLVNIVRYSFDVCEPANCPLCKSGSQAIDKPKRNWKLLTGNTR